MRSSGEIKSEKLSILEIFKNWWFRIPEYQRPYVWESDQVNDLLDDLKFGMTERSEFSYFLGTFVFQSEIDPCGIRENHLLDGQQRMATILLLMAVIRDLSQDLVKCIEAKKAQKIVGESENTKTMDTEVADAKEKIESCQMCIYQKGNKTMSIPEQIRLDYKARPEIQKFIEDNIKRVSGTCNEEKFSELRKKKDISIRNMANAILVMRSFFRNNQDIKPGNFLEFLLNNVLMIYVSTDNLEDAIRLFTILNNRGVPLRNSDILKAINLALRYFLWVTLGYRFSISDTKPRNESGLGGDWH